MLRQAKIVDAVVLAAGVALGYGATKAWADVLSP
jgi:hypothetical protein